MDMFLNSYLEHEERDMTRQNFMAIWMLLLHNDCKFVMFLILDHDS